MMIPETVHDTKFDESVGPLTDLANKFTASIQSGDKKSARALLEQLLSAQPKLDVNITVPVNDNFQRKQEKEFSVRVHIEDREASGGVFFMKVKSCDTVYDLKRRFLLLYNLPIEVQRWIIERAIRDDKCTLHSCGVKANGATLFLYIVTAHSVGLTLENFEMNRRACTDWRYPMPMNQQLSCSSDGIQVSSFTGKSSSPGLKSALLDCQFPESIENKDNLMTMSWPSQDTKGLDLVQGLLKPIIPTDVAPSVSSTASPSFPTIQSADSGIGSRNSQDDSSQLLLTSLLEPNESLNPALPVEPEKPGWNCPTCTYRNLPTRPGCAMCAASRPQSYVIPPDYQMTPEEEIRVAYDEEMERKTREPGALGLTVDQEHENLMLQMVQEGLDPQFLEFDEDGFQMLPQSFLHQQSVTKVPPKADSLVPRGPTKTQDPPSESLNEENLYDASDEDEEDA